jgi:hypothetical protein
VNSFGGVLFNLTATSASTNLSVHISGTIETASGGTLQLQYANAVASAGSVTVRRGSWCTIQ